MLRRLLKGRPVVRPWRAAELLYLGAQRASSRSLPLIRVRDRMPADNPCLTHGLKAAGQAVSEAGYRLKWAHDPPPGARRQRPARPPRVLRYTSDGKIFSERDIPRGTRTSRLTHAPLGRAGPTKDTTAVFSALISQVVQDLRTRYDSHAIRRIMLVRFHAPLAVLAANEHEHGNSQ